MPSQQGPHSWPRVSVLARFFERRAERGHFRSELLSRDRAASEARCKFLERYTMLANGRLDLRESLFELHLANSDLAAGRITMIAGASASALPRLNVDDQRQVPIATGDAHRPRAVIRSPPPSPLNADIASSICPFSAKKAAE